MDGMDVRLSTFSREDDPEALRYASKWMPIDKKLSWDPPKIKVKVPVYENGAWVEKEKTYQDITEYFDNLNEITAMTNPKGRFF
jgi:hypothetical protein